MFKVYRDGLVSFAQAIGEDPVQAVYSIICGIAIAIILVLIIQIDEMIKKKQNGLFSADSFRGYMVFNGSYIVVPSKDDERTYTKVSGSIFHFLRDFEESNPYNDEELVELIMKYCKYVDKNYGTDVCNVEDNIGRDYGELLAGRLV